MEDKYKEIALYAVLQLVRSSMGGFCQRVGLKEEDSNLLKPENWKVDDKIIPLVSTNTSVIKCSYLGQSTLDINIEVDNRTSSLKTVRINTQKPTLKKPKT